MLVKAALLLCLLGPTAIIGGTAAAPPEPTSAWQLSRTIASFDRHYFTNPDGAEAVRQTGNLAGLGKGGLTGNKRMSGWVEYDFAVTNAGWHELFLEPGVSGNDVFLDGRGIVRRGPGSKQDNVWLKAGQHTVRIQRLHWTGLRAVTGWRLRAVDKPDPLCGFSAGLVDERSLLRAGEAVLLDVQGGGLPAQVEPVTLEFQLHGKDGAVVAREPVNFPPGDEPRTERLTLPCPAGELALRVVINGRLPAPQEWVAPPILALDVSPRLATGRELRKDLLAEIDCVATAPNYVGGGETRIVKKPFGAYRESGEKGWLQYMDATNPSWFAYAFTVPDPQQPYWFEVDYPDDQRRTFCLAVREGTPGAYPTTAGADTGGEYALSNTMQSQGILHWARGTELRLLCITPTTGYRAAAARIRLYRLPDGLPKLRVPSSRGRGFGNWYEEGGSVMGIYAAPDRSLAGSATAMERWAQSISYMGGDTLIYTMAIYQFGLYPSRYNVSHGSPLSPDVVGSIVLACEKYGLKFFGEFHPEARELNWPLPGWDGGLEDGDNRMLSCDGKRKQSNTEPAYSPLWPANRRWYLGMIGEFAERYKDSPAFKGVSLRLSVWVNPGLNNFHSAEWSYDDYTIGLFTRETGIRPEAAQDTPARYRQRYNWLKKNAWDEWLDWRCARITALHREIAARVRAVRADLQVVLHGDLAGARGAGIDPSALAEIPGVMLLGGCSYGRRGRSVADNIRLRTALVDPDKLKRICPPGRPGTFLFGAGYFEATGVVVPPEQLGFDPKTKRTWMSGVVNPAGRNYLERYALALAEADAQFLADGGNAYTIGQPLLREFLREYRALPPAPFSPRQGARDPVAVWERGGRSDQLSVTSDQLPVISDQLPVISDQLPVTSDTEPDHRSPITDYFFYLVNRESYPVTVKLAIDGEGQLNRLATGEAVALEDGILTVDLPAFGLRTYSASPSRRIATVTTIPPPAEQAKAQLVSDWLSRTATAAETRSDLQPAEKQTLRDAAQTAARELAAGHLWRVKTLCQTERLQQIFQKMLLYPPLPYPRPEGGPKLGGGRYTPQRGLNQPDTLAALLTADGKPGVTAAVPGQESLDPLATWTGADATVTPGFQAAVPQRYRLWARLATGAGCAGLSAVHHGNVLPLVPRDESEPGSGLIVRTVGLGFLPGDKNVTLRAVGEGQVYLDQLCFEPLYTPVEPLAFAAYFANPGQTNWEQQLPPETAAGAGPDATFAGTDGKDPREVRWEPYPAEALRFNHNVGIHGAWGSVRCPPGPLGKEVIAYCRTIITAPTARSALIQFGATSQIRLFINGALIADSVTEKFDLRWHRGLQSRRIDLKAGDNVLLVKLGNAGDNHPEFYRLIRFHAVITDPGDLTFSADLKTRKANGQK